MKYLSSPQKLGVSLLTLFLVLAMTGCAYGRYAQSLYTDTCNSHAYVQLFLEDYLSKRFPSRSPVRMAVIPFSVPANLASTSSERPGVGNELAWKVHANLLESGKVPVVEVFNRMDWPGKKDEFFTGNFGALALARQAGYDLILVGYLEAIQYPTTMSLDAKIIEVESGITVWYGKTTVETVDPRYQRSDPWWLFGTFWWPSNRQASRFLLDPLVDQLAQCLIKGILSYEPVAN